MGQYSNKGVKAVIKKTDDEVLLVANLMHKTYNKYKYNTKTLGQKPVYKKIGE